ncbi:Uclacyanin 1 [Camellia lanceoleosa]|uniref:Uclacyanin 1 n=2 Tax=Camellia lanceoleosa TaxID=1840588 RepID=A0ACC0H5E2_9ERIC|nr:Uclacyanin 1 [Camellia lanceoleosa]KAI8008519.1 Uclacyanin 1 [Camellia lanceoleosa]
MAMLRTLVSLAVTGMLINVAMATSYTVGSPNGGWDLTTNLQGWASSQSFSAGDSLVFQYTPNHDVLEVTKADYDSCQTSNPLQTHTGSNTVIALPSPGKRYFICGTLGHCAQGMKLEIDTLATSAPPPTSPATPPPTATPTTPPQASPVSKITPPPTATSAPPPTSPATPPPTATPTTPPQASPVSKITPPPTATPASPPHASPITPVSSPPPKSVAHPPMHSPVSAPTMSPPMLRKSPVSSPTSSPVVPLTESPINSPSPSGSTPPPPSSSATKVNTLVGSMGFGFAMVMLLTL